MPVSVNHPLIKALYAFLDKPADFPISSLTDEEIESAKVVPGRAKAGAILAAKQKASEAAE